MKKFPAIHWAGGLKFRRRKTLISIADGFPACVSGPQAFAVRKNGTQSWYANCVTCKKCLKLLDEQDEWARELQ